MRITVYWQILKNAWTRFLINRFCLEFHLYCFRFKFPFRADLKAGIFSEKMPEKQNFIVPRI